MSAEPPAKLLELLASLRLATPAQVRVLASRVRRMARDLPLFDMLWIDVLLQAGFLTPFQAAEIRAGRGASLRLGTYVLTQRLAWPLFAAGYQARHIDTGENVLLIILGSSDSSAPDNTFAWNALLQRWPQWESPGVAAVRGTAVEDGRRYVVTRPIPGQSAAEWIVRHGHFSAPAVLEIARQMAANLAKLEAAGLSHGDVSSHSLILTAAGDVVLLAPGLRALARPAEGYAQLDLRPEAYAFLAPERVAAGKAPGISADIYACGCVWWHLLCGRLPLPTGSSLATLRAAEAGAIADVRAWAPDVPPLLAEVIAACLQKDPQKRPLSMARLAAQLGPPTSAGRAAVRRCLGTRQSDVARTRHHVRRWLNQHRPALWFAGTALLLLAAVTIPRIWRPHSPPASFSPARQSGIVQANASPRPLIPRPLVLPASHIEPLDDPVMLLRGSIDASTLVLRPGQRIVAARDHRVAIRVPPDGWCLQAENVRFENVDFVCDPPAAPGTVPIFVAGRHKNGTVPLSPTAPGKRFVSPMLRLEASRASFWGCSFCAPDDVEPGAPALCWSSPPPTAADAPALPSGRLKLDNCLFWSVDAAVEIRAHGALAVELNNTLHAYSGPLIRSLHCPTADEPLVLSISRLTLREAGAVWECRYQNLPHQPGTVTVRAVQCVLTPLPNMPLVLFCGAESPDRAWQAFQWIGEGSLLGPRCPTAGWQAGRQHPQWLDDSAVPIAGLVRSEVAFAGVLSADPGANQAVRWQVPLRTADPPGIDPTGLPNRRK